MTECTPKSMGFTRLGRRQGVADFLGGRSTSDAGSLLLREVDRRLGLLDAINRRIPDPRDPRYTVHEQRALLAQRIFSIALGSVSAASIQRRLGRELRDDAPPANSIPAASVRNEVVHRRMRFPG